MSDLPFPNGHHHSESTSSLNPYRRPVQTKTLQVNVDSISFTPSPTGHPYENPQLVIKNENTRKHLLEAASLLKAGSPVAFPTETVYGLGADATSTPAVQSIYAAKSRPADNPLIVHVSSLVQLRALLPPAAPGEDSIPAVYHPLIERFWPGPLTILLPLPDPSPLSPNVTASQPTFAARMPDHPIALALCSLSGLPLAAPSANASGKPSPTTAHHVLTDLDNKIPLIIDGGSAEVGLESTVVDGLHDPPVVLRPGGVSAEELRECGGVWSRVQVFMTREDDADTAVPRAPGMKYKHYSPRAGVILYDVGANPPAGRDIIVSAKYLWRVGIVRTRTWKKGFAEEAVARYRRSDGTYEYGDTSGGRIEIFEEWLGTDGKDIGRGLFAVLRRLDELGVDVIHVEGIEEDNEGLAVMNRLGKAASVVVRKVR